MFLVPFGGKGGEFIRRELASQIGKFALVFVEIKIHLALL